jgi:hypothetical protein
MSNHYSVLWVMDQNHVCDLSVRVSPSSLMALFAGLCLSLALRLTTFASWFFLFPLGVWAFLTGGLLPRLGRPCRDYCVPHMRDASGLGTLTTRGEVRCPHMQRHRLHAFVKGFWSLHCSPNIIVFVIHVPMTSSYAASSRVHSRSPVRSSPSPGPLCG